MDQRDDLTWIALELTKFGEQRVEDGTIAGIIRKDLDAAADHLVFVPALGYTKGNRRITLHLMEGYVFIAAGLPEVSYFALEKKPYANQVMSTRGGPHQMRALSVIDNDYVTSMRTQLRGMIASDIEMGTKVRMINGRYKSLEGTVLDLEDDYAFVGVELRSLKVIATVPKIFLESEDTVPEV